MAPSLCSSGELKLFLAIFLTFLATVFTWFASFDCRFFTAQNDYAYFAVSSPRANGDIVGAGAVFPMDRGYGIWTVQDQTTIVGDSSNPDADPVVEIGRCQLYPNVADGEEIMGQFDPAFRFARAVSVVSLILSVIMAVLIGIALFIESIKRGYLFFQGLTMYLIVVMMVVEFIILDSRLCRDQMSCQMSISGVYAIIAAVLWFLAGTSSFFVESAEDRDLRRRRRALRTVPNSSLSVKNGEGADEDGNGRRRRNSCNNNGPETRRTSTSRKDPAASSERKEGETEEDATSITDVDQELQYSEPVYDRMETISLA